MRAGPPSQPTTCGRSPPSVGSSPSFKARAASSTRASASRCAVVRKSISVSVVGRGAASGLSVQRRIPAASRLDRCAVIPRPGRSGLGLRCGVSGRSPALIPPCCHIPAREPCCGHRFRRRPRASAPRWNVTGFPTHQLSEQISIAALPHHHHRHNPILEQRTDNPGRFALTHPGNGGRRNRLKIKTLVASCRTSSRGNGPFLGPHRQRHHQRCQKTVVGAAISVSHSRG